jgi:hypothetical protein
MMERSALKDGLWDLETTTTDCAAGDSEIAAEAGLIDRKK